MGYTKLLVLLLAFLAAILLHLFLTVKEPFANPPRTPLTKENVQALIDEFTQDVLSNYQKFKKEGENLKDRRIRTRLIDIGSFIGFLNGQYPAIQYTIETYDYRKLNMISLEDLKLVKNFAVYRVGITGESAINDSANLADIDLFSNRIQSIMGIIQQKSVTIQGASDMLVSLNSKVRIALENIRKFKLNMANLRPQDIPLLRSDLYYYAFIQAVNNFVEDPALENAEIPILEMNNLPVSKSATDAVVAAITSVNTPPTPSAPSSVAPAAPSAPSVSSALKLTPTGLKFSELIQTLMAYTPIQEAQKQPQIVKDVPGIESSKTIDSANVDQIRSTIREEIGAYFKNVKEGPKDKANSEIASRSTEPVPPVAPKVASDNLYQGSWFRTAAEEGCPYAQGQVPSPLPYPIDMNDYIRKDSIPCWGCKLK